MKKKYLMTEAQITKIFIEWEKRRRNTPEQFINPEVVEKMTVKKVGTKTAETFMELVGDMFYEKVELQ